jgi:cell division control protein 24
MLLDGFLEYFDLVSAPDSRQSTDPVTQLWDLFSHGTPLCYIFDQLPEDEGFNKINKSHFTEEEKGNANPDRAKKHAIALFAMQIRSDAVSQHIPGCELFTISDLWDRNLDSTDGFVKVCNPRSIATFHLRYSFPSFLGHSNCLCHRATYSRRPFRSSPVIPTLHPLTKPK